MSSTILREYNLTQDKKHEHQGLVISQSLHPFVSANNFHCKTLQIEMDIAKRLENGENGSTGTLAMSIFEIWIGIGFVCRNEGLVF